MPQAETIGVAMSPESLRVLRESVEAGEHASVGQALDAAVRAWQRGRRDDAERLDAIRARIRRSLDDPRPDLTSADVQEQLDATFAESGLDARRA